MSDLEPFPDGYETTCQPWAPTGRPLPNCGRRYRNVNGVGWVDVAPPQDS